MTNNRIVITKYNNKVLILFVKDDITVKIRAIDEYDEYTNTVYLGRINKVKDNINAAFVKYSGKTGFLKNNNMKPETVLPIMLKKETDKNKEDEVTDKITISGIYTVVSNTFNGISFSSRLHTSTKDAILNSLNEAIENNNIINNDFNNVIIRNNAGNVDIGSVINEYKYLSKINQEILDKANSRTDNSILYKGIPLIIDYIFSEDISEYNEVLTDLDEAYELLLSFIEKYNKYGINIPIKVSFYKDNSLPLNVLLSLSSKIDRATNRKVYLKSDAYITIDHTEAMTVIDVNSGTTTFKGDKDLVIHKINLEAAKEIAIQLKLRNIAGIIIVDFINEYKAEYKEELLSAVIKELKDDDCHAKCHGMTKLGLIEITRNRRHKALKEQLWN